MRPRTIVAFASAALAVCAACSTFSEAPNEPANDGGTDAAAPSDAETPSDAGTDAWVPCSRRVSDSAHFCDDFDREGSVSFGWSGLLTAPDAAVGELYATGSAFATSFRGRLPASDSPPGRVQLRHTRPPPASKYHLELDVRVDAIPHGPAIGFGFSHLVVVQFDDAPCLTGTNNQRSFELSLYPTNERVTLLAKGLGQCPDGGGTVQPQNDDFAKTPAQLVDGKFHHVSITIAKGPCPGTQSKLSVLSAIDDLRPACRPIDIDMLALTKQIDTYVGPYVGGNGYADTAFVYDNVTIDFE